MTDAINDIRGQVHPSYSSLTELRSLVIPLLCRSGYSQANDTYLLKRKLCLENMAVIDIVDPGLSASRGRLLYELQSCQFGHAQKLLLSDQIDIDEFYNVVTQCQKHLTEASRCLRNETMGSNNQKYERMINHCMSTFSTMLETR